MSILDLSAFGGLVPKKRPEDEDPSPYQIKAAAADTPAPNAFDHALTVRRMLHPDTISPNDAPTPTPIQPHDIGGDYLNDTYNQWSRSPDPYKRRIAWSKQAGPNVPYPTDRTAAENRTVSTIDAGPDKAQGGFMGHVKGFGAGLLLGGIPGAVAGAIKPQLVENVRHNMGIDRAAHEGQIERGIVDQQYNQGERMANLSGTNPFTGGQTESAKLREQQQQYLNAWRQTQAGFTGQKLDISRQNSQSLIATRQERMKDAPTRLMVQTFNRHPETFGPEERATLAEHLGLPELLEPFDPRKFKEVIDDQGNYQRVNVQTNEAAPTTGVGGRPLGSMAGTRERNLQAQRAAVNARTGTKVTPEMRAQANKAARDAVLSEWQKSGKADAGGTMPDPGKSAEYHQMMGKFAKRVPVDKHAGFQSEVKARAAQMLQTKGGSTGWQHGQPTAQYQTALNAIQGSSLSGPEKQTRIAELNRRYGVQ